MHSEIIMTTTHTNLPTEFSANFKPTFGIADKNKVKVPTLIHCFMEIVVLDTTSLPVKVTATNSAVYEAVYDNFIIDPLVTTQKVIVSFQKHTYGKYAVIRNFKEKTGK